MSQINSFEDSIASMSQDFDLSNPPPTPWFGHHSALAHRISLEQLNITCVPVLWSATVKGISTLRNSHKLFQAKLAVTPLLKCFLVKLRGFNTTGKETWGEERNSCI